MGKIYLLYNDRIITFKKIVNYYFNIITKILYKIIISNIQNLKSKIKYLN